MKQNTQIICCILALFFGTTLSTNSSAESLENKLDRALDAIEQLSVENRDLKQRLEKLETSSQASTKGGDTPAQADHEEQIDYPQESAVTNHEERISELEDASSSSIIHSLLEKISIYGYSSFEYERQLESDSFVDG